MYMQVTGVTTDMQHQTYSVALHPPVQLQIACDKLGNE